MDRTIASGRPRRGGRQWFSDVRRARFALQFTYLIVWLNNDFHVELVKINHYKAPRDKLICILNCCKVIFGPLPSSSCYKPFSDADTYEIGYIVGLIRHLGTDESADSFIPILIFVVLKANPEHLLSNVECVGSRDVPLETPGTNSTLGSSNDSEIRRNCRARQDIIFRVW